MKTKPMTRRYEEFLAMLSHSAKSNLTPKMIFRVQHSRPFLATGRMHDAVARVWVVPSVVTEGRDYLVHLDSGRCTYEDNGIERACPDRSFNHKIHCSHFHAASHAESLMFGGRADKAFKAAQAA